MSLTGRWLASRAAVLFLNFFLITLAYYQVKSASRSLLIEYWGADRFAYVWIISALALVVFIGIYHRLVGRFSRIKVVLASCLLFIAMMVAFRLMFGVAPTAAALVFYVFVDIFSVVLVEQFWSLANSITARDEGRRSYWFVSTGGLVGALVGGGAAVAMLEYTAMGTADLLLSSAVILTLVFAVNLKMGRMGMYTEVAPDVRIAIERDGWRSLLASRYLLLIAAALFCAQLAQPLVEYQFIKTVEASYQVLDERTSFISAFFGVLGFVSIGVNLVLTPFVHRFMGVMAGLLVQPLLLLVFSVGFMIEATLLVASAMKISDRGLSYSINRASKEQLYIPIDPVHTYQAKAWIDMLGYRLFKVLGSVIILLSTQWLPVSLSVAQISWLTATVCIGWFVVLRALAKEYRLAQPVPVVV